eukprot:2900997-Amphidinium_carterae.2
MAQDSAEDDPTCWQGQPFAEPFCDLATIGGCARLPVASVEVVQIRACYTHKTQLNWPVTARQAHFNTSSAHAVHPLLLPFEL